MKAIKMAPTCHDAFSNVFVMVNPLRFVDARVLALSGFGQSCELKRDSSFTQPLAQTCVKIRGRRNWDNSGAAPEFCDTLAATRRCGEMADATDLKSVGLNSPCRFESGHRQASFQRYKTLENASFVLTKSHPLMGHSTPFWWQLVAGTVTAFGSLWRCGRTGSC